MMPANLPNLFPRNANLRTNQARLVCGPRLKALIRVTGPCLAQW